VVANNGATLTVQPGEIHALVGQNGSGKSTLVKILAGQLRPDAGTIRLDGMPATFRSPRDAIAAGIGIVNQEFMLAGNLSALENAIVGAEPARWGRIDFAEARQRLRRLSTRYGLPVDLERTVDELGVSERQRVEILKVLFRGGRLLVLDEPTAALSAEAAAGLLSRLPDFAARGLSVVLVSHRLEEVIEVADRVSVMRAGRTVATVERGEVDAAALEALLLGPEVAPAQDPSVGGERRGRPAGRARAAGAAGAVVLEVVGAGVADEQGRWLVEDVSFRLCAGEVLGIGGLEGDGQRELLEALIGLRSLSRGSISLGGQDITRWSTRARREFGMGYVPEDRRGALLISAPLWENALLGHQTSPAFLSRRMWVDRRAARERAAEVCRRFGIIAPGVEVAAGALSGGSQQKLVMGRELSIGLSLLVLAQPSRGVDVAARAVLHEAIRRERSAGLAVVLASADQEELAALADTVLVLRRGRVAAENSA
jgi:simple sugar transport system ATP-binding protein